MKKYSIKFWNDWLEKDSIGKDKQIEKIIAKHARDWIKDIKSGMDEKTLIFMIQHLFTAYCNDLYSEIMIKYKPVILRPKKECVEMIRVTTGCSEYTARRCAERIFGGDFNSDEALKIKYDCMWIDNECKKCKFYHNVTTEIIECPRGLNPKVRILG